MIFSFFQSFAISLPSLILLAYPFRRGVNIVAPPRPTYSGILQIPERSHPFISPGPNDLRGPCPGLNILANHGYLPRNGIASFEQIVNATTYAFNMDYDLASTLAGFAMMARGNPYINKLSIGLDTPLIPPLPGKIDGNKTRGLAAHGRMEGDVSMTRQDWAIGDHVHFQPDLFAELLDIVAQVGNDSDVTGPKSIVNAEALSLFKLKRFEESRSQNPELQYHFWRLSLSYGDSGFLLTLFPNGTDGTLSVPAMTSFLRDERFPDNWYRRSSPGTFSAIGSASGAIMEGNPVPPGATDPNGTYIVDPGPFADCDIDNTMAGDNIPGVLVNTTGILKKNVDFLLNSVHYAFLNCTPVVPHGAANV